MLTWVISDTHCLHGYLEVPDVELVIHCGDVGGVKNPAVNANEVLNFIEWFKSLPIKYKIWIAGNHDTSIEAGLVKPDVPENDFCYLQHESCEIEGLKFFGSPYTPEFCNWAFNVSRGDIGMYWDDIPMDTDILITHGPPYGILDKESGEHLGDKALLARVTKVQPRYHFFGHIHGGQGHLSTLSEFYNCSVLNEDYEIFNNGIIIDI